MTGQYHPVLRPLRSKIFVVLASLHTVMIEGVTYDNPLCKECENGRKLANKLLRLTEVKSLYYQHYLSIRNFKHKINY
jgi:hypothetical protein